VELLWADKEKLFQKRQEVEAWYKKFKENLSADVNDILSGGNPTRGGQWKYQREGLNNIKMLVKWFLHFDVEYNHLIIKRILSQL